MADSLSLPKIPRETLLPEAARLSRLQRALPQIREILAGETEPVALQATLACLLWEVLGHCNFCGFYRRVTEQELVIGPYQGSLGCLRIALTRGVCGAAARSGAIQRVAEVSAFPDHIACDNRSRSELVIPVFQTQRVVAVLDLDSPHPAAFSAAEATLLDQLLRAAFSQGAWPN